MAKRPSFFHHLHPPYVPAREARFRYTFGLGGISLYLFFLVLVTGALEMFYYIPSGVEANKSLHVVDLLVPYGRLVRSIHFWSAQLLLVAAALHMLRIVLTGGYKSPRRFNWLLGLSLLVLLLLFDFTGYALRWDIDIAWALLVGTNLLKSIPVAGQGLYAIAVGGQELGPATVVRLYGWHVFGLTLVAITLVAWHIFRVRRDGGISRAATDALVPRTISRHELVRREALAALVVSILVLLVALAFPPGLAPSADFQDLPQQATAPWFFLWIQQLLRYGEPFVAGIAIPLLLLILLASVPYALDREKEGSGLWFNRTGRIAQLAVMAILLFIIGLTLRGAL